MTTKKTHLVQQLQSPPIFRKGIRPQKPTLACPRHHSRLRRRPDHECEFSIPSSPWHNSDREHAFVVVKGDSSHCRTLDRVKDANVRSPCTSGSFGTTKHVWGQVDNLVVNARSFVLLKTCKRLRS